MFGIGSAYVGLKAGLRQASCAKKNSPKNKEKSCRFAARKKEAKILAAKPPRNILLLF